MGIDLGDRETIDRWLDPGRNSPLRFDPEDADDVEEAERFMIRQGRGDEYGRALLKELWGDCADFEEDAGVHTYTLLYSHVATVACTPLDVRVRALASVIRELK